MEHEWKKFCNSSDEVSSNEEQLFFNKLARYNKINSYDKKTICETLKTDAERPTQKMAPERESSFKDFILKQEMCANPQSGFAQELSDIPPERFITFDDNGKLFYCDDVLDLNTQILVRSINPFTNKDISLEDRKRIKDQINRLSLDEPPMYEKLTQIASQIFRNPDLYDYQEWPLDNFVRMGPIDFNTYINKSKQTLGIRSPKNDNLSLRKLEFCNIIKNKLFYLGNGNEQRRFKQLLNNSMLHFDITDRLLTPFEINEPLPAQRPRSPSPGISKLWSFAEFPSDDSLLNIAYYLSWDREANLWEQIVPGIVNKSIEHQVQVKKIKQAPINLLKSLATLHGLEFKQDITKNELILLIDGDMRDRKETLKSFINVFWNYLYIFNELNVERNKDPKNEMRLEWLLYSAPPEVIDDIAKKLNIDDTNTKLEKLIVAIKSEIKRRPNDRLVWNRKFKINIVTQLCYRIQKFQDYRQFYRIESHQIPSFDYLKYIVIRTNLSQDNLIELANIQHLNIPENVEIDQLFELITTDLQEKVSKSIVTMFFREMGNSIVLSGLSRVWGSIEGLNAAGLIRKFNQDNVPLEKILKTLDEPALRQIARTLNIEFTIDNTPRQLIVKIKTHCRRAAGLG